VIDRTLQMSGVAAFALDRNDELPVMKESEPNRGPQQLRLLFGFNGSAGCIVQHQLCGP
jgi:hypothetical protein